MARLYQYVGPVEIRERSRTSPPGTFIQARSDLLAWLHAHHADADLANTIVATFVIDEAGTLRLAPRQSEHVACAAGGPVHSAGEITLTMTGDVIDISNQSTGFCPEPESWSACEEAFNRLSISHPSCFTHAVIFRRCPACGERNLVKDDWFVCDLCGSDLPQAWNFSPE